VTLAYEQLSSEGYMEARRGSGMYVCSTIPDQVLKVTSKDGAGRGPRSLPPRDDPFEPRPHSSFSGRRARSRAVPHATWSRLLARAWRNPVSSLTGDPTASDGDP